MAIADQLTLLNATKTAIKDAIEAKGTTVGGVPFGDYPALIAAIAGGGGGADPSATPTLSGASTFYFNGEVTITNWGTYIDPNANCTIVDSAGTVVIANANITVSASGVISFVLLIANGSYSLKVSVQDFSLGVSTEAVFPFTKTSATFRYFRLSNIVQLSGSGCQVPEWRMYPAAGQTGTAIPPSLTAATAPSPYVVTSSFFYNATYADWKAFDATTTGTFWWTLGHTNAQVLNDWLQIDLGTETTVKSMKIMQGGSGYISGSMKITASNTGTFTGEEIDLGTITLNQTPGSYTFIG